MHRKEPVQQRVSITRLFSVGAVAAVVIAVLGFAGLIATWAIEDATSVADAGPAPTPSHSAPALPPPVETPEAPKAAPPVPFPFDDRGFIDSAARCQGSQPAYAIGRTPGSLVVICGEQAGRYEYLGVRLRDAAVLRTNAQTDSPRSFLAQKAGVVYAVSPTELKVTSGGNVIKQEPMISYREVAR